MSLPPAFSPGHPYSATTHISFTFHHQQTSPTRHYNYFLSLPPAYSITTQNYPLLLFLHGSGESQQPGYPNSSFLSLRHGIPKIILCYDKLKSGLPPMIDIPTRAYPGRSAEEVPPEICTLVAEEFITVTPSLKMEEGYGWDVEALEALLDEVILALRVDVDRVHVTGFSMGGFGTWELGARCPRRFASFLPICGGGNLDTAEGMKAVPQWVHHGEDDDVISVKESKNMCEALEKVGAEVRLTLYPGVGHDSWTIAYGNVEVFKWILEKRRVSLAKMA